MENYDAVDLVRTVILLIGFTLALVCVKFAYLALRNGEGFRAWGLASYGFIVISPAVIGLFRYDQPLIWQSTVTYALGLFCGIMALRTVLTITPEWSRLRLADRNRRADTNRAERRDAEDTLRHDDRHSQDVERRESRSMHPLDPERTDAEDENRVESRGLQDTERDLRRNREDENRE